MGAALNLDYRREVEQMLKKYPTYKQSMNVFPACTQSYEERINGGEQEFISSTEKYAFIRIERRELVEGVEFALSFLTTKEKELIYLTYFQEEKPLINIVWRQLHMSKSTYYRQRDSVLDKVANMLNGKNAGTFGNISVLS